MGMRGTFRPPTFPILVTVAACLAALGVGLEEGCEMGGCYDLYLRALEGLNVPTQDNIHTDKQREGNCIALRTYYQCIHNVSKNKCRGNLNFHSVKSIAEKMMKNSNCSKEGKTYDPPGSSGGPSPDPLVCVYEGKKIHRQCMLFGDPHLKTFLDSYQTCKVQGAWPLVSNEYFLVQVTNAKVANYGPATATNMLTVMIKRNFMCGEDKYTMYQASSGYLPATFDDGSVAFGEQKSVTIRNVEPNKHVEIYIRYIDTTIVVQQVGRHFTFAINMPEELVNKSLADPDSMDLCSKGCPASEQINLSEILDQRRKQYSYNLQNKGTQPAMSRSDAVAKCRQVKVVDFFFDSCVFDLMTTGDVNFTLAAYEALRIMLKLDPSAVSRQANRTDLLSVGPSNGSRHPASTLYMQYKFCYILMALCTLLLSRHRFNVLIGT